MKQRNSTIVLKCTCRAFDGERILLLPATWTVRPLHRALQVAFGWDNDHVFRLRDAAKNCWPFGGSACDGGGFPAYCARAA